MTRFRASCAGAAAGILLDRAFGEPRVALHPVARFGQAMLSLENRIHRDSRGRGVVFALVGVVAAAATAAALEKTVAPVARNRHSRRFLTTALVSWIAIAGRMLGDVARDIEEPLRTGDLAVARRELRSLVGRDTTSLASPEVARAVTESVAENTVDAVVAPALWGAIGGPVGAAAYRAVNTLDAMVGHRSERYARFGWASARLDDVANWIPARCTAALVAAVRPGQARDVSRVVRRDAPAHPSPNSGVAEAAFAAAIGVRLGGVNHYGDRTEDRGTLGDGREPDVAAIGDARVLLRHVSLALVVALVLTAGAPGLVRG